MGNKLANLLMAVGIILLIFAIISFAAAWSTGNGDIVSSVGPISYVYLFAGLVLTGIGNTIKKTRNKAIHDSEVSEIAKSEIQKAASKEEMRRTAIEEQRKKMENGEITQEEYLRTKKAIEEVK